MRGCASSAFVGSWEVAAAAETAVAYFEVSGQWRLLHGVEKRVVCTFPYFHIRPGMNIQVKNDPADRRCAVQ